MLLLVSDANILIDIDSVGLAAAMFDLGYQFVVPDILYEEEIEEQHGHLIALGLEPRALDGATVARVVELARIYPRPSRNDLVALALAEHEGCPLLTGDRSLREAATAVGIEVRGTIWLVEEMVRRGKLTIDAARAAYVRMREIGRRLPWDDAELRLTILEAELRDDS